GIECEKSEGAIAWRLRRILLRPVIPVPSPSVGEIGERTAVQWSGCTAADAAVNNRLLAYGIVCYLDELAAGRRVGNVEFLPETPVPAIGIVVIGRFETAVVGDSPKKNRHAGRILGDSRKSERCHRCVCAVIMFRPLSSIPSVSDEAQRSVIW